MTSMMEEERHSEVALFVRGVCQRILYSLLCLDRLQYHCLTCLKRIDRVISVQRP